MRKKLFILLLAATCGGSLFAQSESDYEGPSKGTTQTKTKTKTKASEERQTTKSSKKKNKSENQRVYTGFSGGMLVHLGYGLPAKQTTLFGNSSASEDKDGGVMVGIGGQLRVHLYDHMRVGAEGYFSSMPKGTKSSVRMGWGGAMVDGYMTWGNVRPFIGMGIGGGSISRTYVNEDVRAVNSDPESADAMVYNASFSKTPFFYLDPTIGMEIKVANNFGIVIRLDYMLPFGRDKQITQGTAGSTIDEGTKLLSPNGPRFYLGFVFDHSKKSKK